MNDLLKYNKVFSLVFNVSEAELNNGFAPGQNEKWDSIMHLSLITAIEDEFDIMFDSEDILDFKSYEKGKMILSKYDIQL